MVHLLPANAPCEFLIIPDGGILERCLQVVVAVPVGVLSCDAVPWDDEVLVCDDTGLQSDKRIADLEGGCRRKRPIELVWVVNNIGVRLRVVEHK
jgi:hypothetical protein